VPEAYYAVANSYMVEMERNKVSALRKMKHYFNLGKEAEDNMLPCYLPYGESDVRRGVENIISVAAKVEEGGSLLEFGSVFTKPANEKGILEEKQYLANPLRKQMVIRHRQGIADFAKLAKRLDHIEITQTIPPKLIQTTPRRMGHVKPISLKEMNPTTDHIYEDRLIDLTLIEDPSFGFASIHLIAEDENGDVTRLYIYNVEQNKEAEEKLGHGSRIVLLNPYMRIGSQDYTNGIRVDEPRCVVYLDEDVGKLCRFCGTGEESVPFQCCALCKKASYCSKECQTLDWKVMKHKLICLV